MEAKYSQPGMKSYRYGAFKPLGTIELFGSLLFASFTLTLAGVLVSISVMDPENRCEAFFKLVYGQVGLWFLTLLLGHAIRDRHHKLRARGYIEFCNKLRKIHQFPIYIVTAGTSLNLLIEALSQHIFPEPFADRCTLRAIHASPVTYLTVILMMDFFAIIPVGYIYIYRVYQFNKLEPAPDVYSKEWQACLSSQGFGEAEFSQKLQAGAIHDMISKQADMIRYLKDQNEKLSRKILVMQSQRRGRS